MRGGRIPVPAASIFILLIYCVGLWGPDQTRTTHQFALSALPPLGPMGALSGGARGQRAEGRTGAGGQPRIRAVEQPLPVLSFQAVVHRLEVEVPHHCWDAWGSGDGNRRTSRVLGEQIRTPLHGSCRKWKHELCLSSKKNLQMSELNSKKPASVLHSGCSPQLYLRVPTPFTRNPGDIPTWKRECVRAGREERPNPHGKVPQFPLLES